MPAASAKSQKLFFEILQNKVEDFGPTFSYCQQKQPPEVFYKKDVLKNFAKHLLYLICLSILFEVFSGVFLRILQNFYKDLFYRIPLGD